MLDFEKKEQKKGKAAHAASPSFVGRSIPQPPIYAKHTAKHTEQQH